LTTYIESCAACGEVLRIIACTEDLAVIEMTLAHLEAKAAAAQVARPPRTRSYGNAGVNGHRKATQSPGNYTADTQLTQPSVAIAGTPIVNNPVSTKNRGFVLPVPRRRGYSPSCSSQKRMPMLRYNRAAATRCWRARRVADTVV